MTGDNMAMQPSVQLRHALEVGVKRLRMQHHYEWDTTTRVTFGQWTYGRVVVTSDELEAIIKSSQLFDDALDVLAQAVPIVREVGSKIENLSIEIDPTWPRRPMIVAAPAMISV
jgi:hypothetical protein